MHKNLLNWLTLFHTEGIGPIKFKQYLKEDPCLDYLPAIAKNTLNQYKNSIELHLNWSKKDHHHIVLLCDKDYPNILKNIIDPPPILFVYGNKKLLLNVQISIVGSRKASKLGEKIANVFAVELARSKIVITSGLALGIDSAGHKGALSVGGDTIAVLGHGLDLIYPRQNIKLAEQIITNGGAIISEFPLHSKPLAGNFPRRNRIISGLSVATVIVEASIGSGSLITAKYAADQGREVFAVPGCIYDLNFKGCNKLIKQGAKLVESASEILEDLKIICFNHNNNNNQISNLNILDETLSTILTYVSYQVTSVDLIIDRSGLMANIVNAGLVNLELSGYISSVPGGYVKLI